MLEGIAAIAREHSLLVLSDEIYDRILFDGAQHIPMATVAPDLLCLTFNGLSKTYRVAGYRSGWLVVTGPREHATGFLEGITLLASTRLCPNVPAQHAVQAALGGVQSIDALIAPGGRLHEQRDVAYRGLTSIPGVDCVRPDGALYLFPRLDPDVHEIRDDAPPRLRPAGERAHPAGAGHGLQLADPGPPAHRHAPRGPRPGRGDRAHGQLPVQLPPVAPARPSRRSPGAQRSDSEGPATRR